ncbi:MAG: hypothetical protein IPK64_14215 [bacterium]|nr:hypothetical protein [bacterium]
MKLPRRIRLSRRALALGGLAATWFLLLVVGALPAWQRALIQHREVRKVEGQMDELDRWSVAGLWLERTLPERAAAVDPAWNRLFPAERACERLFLDLARIADESGVSNFELHELRIDELTDAVPGLPAEEPAATLGAYRVRARFDGDFAGVAGFLGGLGRLDRAVALHDLEIMPTKDSVHVDLEMDVYVSSKVRS